MDESFSLAFKTPGRGWGDGSVSRVFVQSEGPELDFPSAHVKPDMVMTCICNPSVPVRRWEAEMDESLETNLRAGRPSLVHTVAKTKTDPAFNKAEGEG